LTKHNFLNKHLLQNCREEVEKMKKSTIGLILAVIGFLIVLISFVQTNLLNAASMLTCWLGVIIGGIIFLLGVAILAARFSKWSHE
jgi:hypothetical protein